MANDQQTLLKNHYKNLIEGATSFAKGAPFYEDKVTGEIYTPTNTYRELVNLLPSKYSKLEQDEFFKTVDANKESDPLIAQYANPVFSTPEPEPEKEEKKKQKEEKKEEPVIKGSLKSKPEEDEEKEEKSEEENSEERLDQEPTEAVAQPVEQTPTIQQEKKEPPAEISTYTNTKTEPQIKTPMEPTEVNTPVEVLPETPIAPKIDIKPTPFIPTPIKKEQPEIKSNTENQKTTHINQPKPINPTPPPGIRTQAQSPKIDTKPVFKPSTPQISAQTNTKPERIATTAPIPRRVVLTQAVKSAVTSAPVKTAVKEVAFQAQMATRKVINKAIDIIGGFARDGLQTVGNFFQGNRPTFDESVEYYVDPNEEYYDYDTNQGVNTPQRRLSIPTPGRSFTSTVRKGLFRRYAVVIGVVVGFFLIYFLIIGDELGVTAPLMTQYLGQSQGQTQPISYNLGGISYCDFTYRANSVGIKSERLKGLFEEVSQLTGVPASVLASVAVHENNVFAIGADDNHDAFTNKNFSGIDCMPHFATSPTGALGLMQVQAPANLRPQNAPNYNPNAYSKEGVEIGLKFLNRTTDSLTIRDFCDLRTNIILGAGVLIAKNGGTPPTTPLEVKEAVCGYYGQCEYGIYNYGEEVQRDFENCQAAPTGQLVSNASFCPIPGGTVTCGSFATPVNACGHCGLNYEENMSICASFPATRYALDIAGNPGQKAVLPTLNGKTLRWEWKFEESKGVDAIQGYVGIDLDSGSRYLLQLHHTQSGSGKRGTSFSGQEGGVICSNCNHLHVQIGQGESIGAVNWLDAARLFCQTQNTQL